MIYSSNTKLKLAFIAKDTPQLILFIGPKGSGKASIMNDLALNITNSPNILMLEPLEGKKTIGIDQLRQIKKTSFLTKSKPFVVLIPQSELLTHEAQNSMLKILEDTPNNLYIFMATTVEGKILETIRSRAHCWRIVNPNETEIKKYYEKESSESINQALLVTEKKSRFLEEYLENDSDDSSVDLAKEILGENKYDRLQRANLLAKDTGMAIELIEAIILICDIAINLGAKQNNINKIKPWKNRLQECLNALDMLEKSVQPKLVLTKLFMVL